MGSRLRESLAEQLFQQGIAHGLHPHLHAGGVDHVFDVEREGASVGHARADLHAALPCDGHVQSRAVYMQLAPREQVAEHRVDGRGNAMPVDIPVTHGVAQETALLAARADVREELDRLAAHVADARAMLKSGQGIGRKLDFLAQEFNREANTLCSKSADIALTRTGLALKAVIDQFREQAQNVE